MKHVELNYCKVTPVCGEKGNIVGKWKLVKATEALVTAPTSIDYSCEDIVYEFRPDNKLVVTSSGERYTANRNIRHYREAIKGDSTSLAAITFSENEMKSVIFPRFTYSPLHTLTGSCRTA